MKRKEKKKGQSAIEYLILATAVAIVVLIGFDEKRGLLVQARNLTGGMFEQALRGIFGSDSSIVSRTDVDLNSIVDSYP